MEVAKGSSNNSEDHLDEKKLNLFSIEDLDLETARKLASSNVEEIEEIHLWSLPTINAETAEALAKFKGMSLGLRALTELDAQTAEALAKFEGDYLLLWGLKKLDLEAAQHLACFGGDLLELSSLENPGADVEKALSLKDRMVNRPFIMTSRRRRKPSPCVPMKARNAWEERRISPIPSVSPRGLPGIRRQ
jgi:hypothetical protein